MGTCELVGKRVQIGKEKASIRYCGELIGHSGQWVGLEWDNPDRGKHNGVTGGHQYFTCKYGGKLLATSGSDGPLNA
jgi:tubulin-specific chaperone E